MRAADLAALLVNRYDAATPEELQDAVSQRLRSMGVDHTLGLKLDG